MANRIPKVSFYDFKRVTLADFETEQSFNAGTSAANFDALGSSGVLLDFPQEKVIFDSDSLDAFQQGLVAINTFDGQGILEEAVNASDLVGGTQLSLTMTDARLDGFLQTEVFIIGKTFDSTLIYEVVEIGNNIVELTKNHFTEVTNILFQNFRGNLNTSVDGYGSFNVGGRIVIAEAGSMKPSRDPVLDQYIDAPQQNFARFKTPTAGQTLSTILTAAVGTSNDVDDLDVNTTVAKTRTFTEGGSTEVIYGQKFQMNGDNIQKITLLLSLANGSDWSGTLVLGIRPLQTTTTCATDFLPDDDIGFDPSTEALEEIVLDQADLANQGVALNSAAQEVEFFFSGSNLSNPTLSNLVEGDFYVFTLRRAGSSATGTLELQEATNSLPLVRRLTVFSNSVWTDVDDSTLWYRVWGDASRAASGVTYDQGVRLVTPKTEIDNNGVTVQKFTEDFDFANTSEDAENYLIVQATVEFTDPEAHPRTGDSIFSRKEDAPVFSMLEQADLSALITANDETVVLGRLKDTNARSNPTITGSTAYPGLALGNVFTIINPGTDLLTQNVVGSILMPNTAKPTLTYRIISQTTFTDLYGDTNSDEIIDVADAARITLLDGYAPDLNRGTFNTTAQLAAMLNGDISVPELLRADVDSSGVINATDLAIINLNINDGYGFPAGSSFTRMELKVEPLLAPEAFLTANAASTITLETLDTDFIDNVTFTAIPYQINFLSSWKPENIEVLDLRRYVSTTFLDFNSEALTASTENGGSNNFFNPGHNYLTGNVLNLDGTFHSLDFEKNIIEITLPADDTAGEFNIFETQVVSKMKFSDGTLVANTAINDNQVKFEVAISSHVKDLDGYDVDPDGYGDGADESIGTYIDHDTGLLRIKASNIVYNTFLPQVRTRILVTVSLKKAGFQNTLVEIDPTLLNSLLT
jgi:hypothetical protein